MGLIDHNAEVRSGVVYGRRRWWGRRRRRQVRLLPIPDDHALFRHYSHRHGQQTVTMADVLAVGMPEGSPRGHAYVMLDQGDRAP